MNLYKLGFYLMASSFVLLIISIYLLFIADIPIAFPWLMFWHFTAMITAVVFKLSYVIILANKPANKYL